MPTHFLKLLLLLISISHSSYAYTSSKENFFARKDIQQFVEEMHSKHNISKKKLIHLFKEYHPNQKVLITMDKQFEALPWYQYRTNLISEKRALEGARFWQKNRAVLKKAEDQFGVPAEIIVAILGIESFYGKKIGNYPVFQTLATLAFEYPRRSAFFKKELEHFLLLSEEGAVHPLKTPGSYAGAIGMPQFMPSSYRQFAVSFSKNSKRDLIHNKADVIGSIANYLKSHGWQPQKPIAYKANFSKSAFSQISASRVKSRLTLGEIKRHQIQTFPRIHLLNDAEKVHLIELQSSKYSKEHWIGFQNFYAITRYNHSHHYAMAVYLLSERIRHLYQRLQT